MESQSVKTSGADLSTIPCKSLSKCKEMLVEGQEKEILNNKSIIKEDKQIYRKEFNNPYTFIGRVTLRNERYFTCFR